MRLSSRFAAIVCLNATLGLSACSLLPSGPSGRAPATADSATTSSAPAAGGSSAARPANRGAGNRPAPAAVRTPERQPLIGPTLEPVTVETAPPEPEHLIARLQAGFALPAVDDANVAAELAWYGSHPDYIARVFDRSRRYLFHIAEALEERGMPADLALLPIVESAFDPFAYSRGRASGLWQIIPGTGERLGLKQNWWYDGRRDVVDSTRAALDYLELLHAQFGGDWLLAVAGYNSGEGNVARAISRAEADGRPTDFWGIRQDLPAETAAYVPKLLAIRDLVADPAAFELELPEIEDAPYFAAVPTDGQIDIALAAEISGLSVDEVYDLNPGINRWATDPDGPHRLLVPVAYADTVRETLAELAPEERVRWSRHEIGRGETLSHIAERYDTTPDVLREINGISGNLIRAGDYLMIPHASAAAGTYSQSLAARTERTQNRDREGTRVDYLVRAGDSLWSIARRHSVGTNELASWNAMAPGDVLSVGRRLVIWTDDPVAAAVSGTRGPAQVRQVNYVVRRGDSLSAIAGRFRVSVNDLLAWNELSADRYLQPGQSLVLYVDVTEQSS
jgi:membrane-bound lytic murein transglycosylase D